jgi:CheY-like chemotaxis protein
MSEHKGEIPKNLSFIIGSVAIQDNSILSREQIVNAAEKIMYLDKKRNLDSESHHMAEMVENKGTVLVVDDEPVIRMILQRSLSSAGYRVLLAEDGESCLEILKREEPEVLILDWILPNMDGMDVCRKVREDQLAKPPYIIVMTIIRGAKSRIHALNTGADDYTSKPIDVDELLARVRVGMRIETLKRQIARAEKLEGVMQMAGAVAHELSQPLTALMGLADLALMRMDASDQNYRHIAQIVELAQRLGDLVKKIGSIMKYETMDYVGHTKIVDIDKASKRNAVKDVNTAV